MGVHICKSVMDNCQNPYDSYGEICVGCNCCGKMGEDTMWQARYGLAIRELGELVEKLSSEHFQSNLQQANICLSISYWSEKLKEILTHLDFDAKKNDALGDNIKRLMKYNGYTQKQLAMRAQCTESAISKYINNQRKPSLQILKNLAIALGVTVDDLKGEIEK